MRGLDRRIPEEPPKPILRAFKGENESLFGWKHPREKILKGKSLNKKGIEEENMGAFTQNRLFTSSFFVSLSFDGFLSLRDALVYFLMV